MHLLTWQRFPLEELLEHRHYLPGNQVFQQVGHLGRDFADVGVEWFGMRVDWGTGKAHVYVTEQYLLLTETQVPSGLPGYPTPTTALWLPTSMGAEVVTISLT